MSAPLTVCQVRRRYLGVHGLRWLITGMLLPVGVLLPLDRGLSLSQFGAMAAVQGLVALALELPTGGLADVIGRRPVLLLSSTIHLVAITVFYFAHSVGEFMIMSVLLGTYVALANGPLDSWYVDTTKAAEPEHDISGGLSAAGVVAGVAVGGGALFSGALVALQPVPGIEPLALPVLAALAVRVVSIIVMAVLIVEERPETTVRVLTGMVRGVSGTMSGALRLAGRSRVLRTVLAVELFWGFGAMSYEVLTPVRLSEVLPNSTAAAAIMAPVTAAAWLASALGASLVPWLSRRVGITLAAATLRILQGAAVVGMGLLSGPVGVIAAYFACYVVHGAANPLHFALLHREVDGTHRATILSLNSLMAQPANSVGLVVLGALASATSVTTAMVVAAVVLAVAAPLYLAAGRSQATEAGPQHSPAKARA